MYIYIYIYICQCIYLCVYIYIYIHYVYIDRWICRGLPFGRSQKFARRGSCSACFVAPLPNTNPKLPRNDSGSTITGEQECFPFRDVELQKGCGEEKPGGEKAEIVCLHSSYVCTATGRPCWSIVLLSIFNCIQVG